MASLDLWSAVLSFLGGGLLSDDALRARRRIKAESGAREFLQILKAHGDESRITDKSGKPLRSETELQLWPARQSSRWAWLG